MSNYFIKRDTPLPGLLILERKPRIDPRGYLERIFEPDAFAEFGWTGHLRQVNHSLSRKVGTVRGLHFQYPPHTGTKVVTCLKGEVFDVAVDIRRGSPTFLHWYAEKISATNFTSLFIPAGFAHGFQTLTDDCELLYLHSEAFRSEAEGGLNIADPRLAIHWPFEISELSDRDHRHPFIEQDFNGLLV